MDAQGVTGWVPDRLLVRKGPVATLLEDYNGTELEVGDDQRVAVLKEESGWLYCQIEKGQRGWVPASHVLVAGKRLTEEFTKPRLDLDELIRERKLAEDALRESEEKYRVLVDHSLQGLMIAEGWPARLVFVNHALAQFLGREPEELLSLPPGTLRALVHEDDREAFFEDYRAHLAGLSAPQRRTFRVVRSDGKLRWIEAYISKTAVQGSPAVQAAVMDITERREAELERERLISELNAALTEIRTLRGIVPICANCKKVRDDQGFWLQVETYVSLRSHAEFSHSICPDCVRLLYPDHAARVVGSRAGDAPVGSEGEAAGQGPAGQGPEGQGPEGQGGGAPET